MPPIALGLGLSPCLGGGRAVFSPLSLSPSLWLRASSLAFVGNGNAVAVDWPDLSGGGNDATPSAGPLFRSNAWNGRPGVEFNGAGRKFVTPSLLTSASDTAFTLYGVVRTQDANLQVWASHNGVELFAAGDGAGGTFNTGGLSDTSFSLGRRDEAYIVRLRYNGVTKSIRIKGKALDAEDSEAATGNLGLDGALTIGCLSNESFGWGAGALMEILAFQAYIGDDDDDLLCAYLAAHYGFDAVDHSSSDPLAVFRGNSLMLGQGASSIHAAIPETVTRALGATWIGVNKGVSGVGTPTLAAADATDLYPYHSAARLQSVAVLWEVSNHLALGAGSVSAATAYAAYVAWCQAAQAQGFKVVACTVIDRQNDGLYGGWAADAASVNSSIRADWATFADALADLADDARLQDATDTDFFNPDKVHLIDAGNVVAAEIKQAAIETL